MEIITKRKEMREVEVIEKVQHICDKCGCDITHRDSSDRTSLKVKFQTGYSFPEGGNITRKQAYFCVPCAGMVEQVLVAIGVKFVETESDF